MLCDHLEGWDREGGREGTLVHCWWECKLVQPLWKSISRFLQILKIEQPHDTAIPLLGIYLKEMRSLSRSVICTPMFIAVLCTVAKIWKQPKCPSMDEWILKSSIVYTMEYYSAIKILFRR